MLPSSNFINISSTAESSMFIASLPSPSDFFSSGFFLGFIFKQTPFSLVRSSGKSSSISFLDFSASQLQSVKLLRLQPL